MMTRPAFALLLLVGCGGSPAPAPDGGADGSLGTTGTTSTNDASTDDAASGGASLGGVQIFPPDNPWNQDVSGADVDPDSDAYIGSIGMGTGLHPDFSSGGDGIPYVVVGADQAMIDMTFTDYADESDPGPYPIPLTAPIEDDWVKAPSKSTS